MEHDTGVGIVVGLAIGTSLYIRNSGKFTKTQKTSLLFCIFFPPLQWVGIIALLIYNNYKLSKTLENTAKSRVEKVKPSLDNSTNNLENLKNKGLLTEEEYKMKIDKIEIKIEEENLINSIEYKQLNSLLKNGILTKQEFEDKLIVLKSCLKNDKKLNISIKNNLVTVKFPNGLIENMFINYVSERISLFGENLFWYNIKYKGTFYPYYLTKETKMIMIRVNGKNKFFNKLEELVEYILI